MPLVSASHMPRPVVQKTLALAVHHKTPGIHQKTPSVVQTTGVVMQTTSGVERVTGFGLESPLFPYGGPF